jgi:hypothetical protein
VQDTYRPLSHYELVGGVDVRKIGRVCDAVMRLRERNVVQYMW